MYLQRPSDRISSPTPLLVLYEVIDGVVYDLEFQRFRKSSTCVDSPTSNWIFRDTPSTILTATIDGHLDILDVLFKSSKFKDEVSVFLFSYDTNLKSLI